MFQIPQEPGTVCKMKQYSCTESFICQFVILLESDALEILGGYLFDCVLKFNYKLSHNNIYINNIYISWNGMLFNKVLNAATHDVVQRYVTVIKDRASKSNQI